MRKTFDFVVVDGWRTFHEPMTYAILDAADPHFAGHDERYPFW